MRTQATLVPTFWTRGSGRKLRGDTDAQVLALYFMSSPHSSMIGLYYEPLSTILHDTGLTEERFRKALVKVAEIAVYDEEEGLVYLPNGAARQIGETMSVNDKKRNSVLSQLEVYGNHPFVKAWIERYYEPYNLSHNGIAKPHRSPSQAPSKGHPGTPDAPDPEAEAETDPGSDPRSASVGSEAPIVASLQVRAQTWVKDPFRASMAYPNPHTWAEMLELRDLLAATFGTDPDTLRGPQRDGSLDPRVQLTLERWAEGNDQARLRAAIRGSKHSELIAGRADLQSLKTIFKDSEAIDKYCKLGKGKESPAVSRTNKVKLTPEAAAKRKAFSEGKF